MLTIFTVPRSFNGRYDLIQRNAILSWLNLSPACEIVLFGDDEGVDKVAKEFNVRHVPEIKKNEFGTPLINDIFEKAQDISKYDILVYINADIILTGDFTRAVERIKEHNFLIIGQRIDLEINEQIDFEKSEWENMLRQKIKKEGKLHGLSGIDYFVFCRGAWDKIPPLALGRTAWDNWFLYKAHSLGMPLIDATQVVTAIHQKHDYPDNFQTKVRAWKGPEAKQNIRLAGGFSHFFTIRDVDLVLTQTGLEKPKLTIYRFLSFPFRYFVKSSFPIRIFLFPGWLSMVLWRKIRHYINNY